jgi:NhaA family Na+:H+ antiporter
MARWRVVLDVLASLAAIVAAAALLLALATRGGSTEEPPPPPPPESLPLEPVSLAGAVLKGDPDAPVAVIEYGDLQCPFCARFARDVMPGFVASYVDTGKVLFAFRHLPLERIHPAAAKLAEAAECAHRQGAFWAMHDALLRSPQGDSGSLHATASASGLDMPRFERCLAGEATPAIRQAVKEAETLGITGTPTFLFGTVLPDGRVEVTRRQSGVPPPAVFAAILDTLLDENGTR